MSKTETKKISRSDKSFKTMSIKGKQYVEVKERIKYLAFDFAGDYSIKTKFWHYPESRTWVVKATLILKQDGLQEIYTGHAQETESDSYKDVNHTSALENCETSAIGRACAMAGIGVDIAIASADEMNKALNRANAAPQQAQAPQPVAAKPTQEKTPQSAPDAAVIDAACKAIQGCTDLECLKQVWANHKDIQKNPVFLKAKDVKKAELSNPVAA